MSIPGFRLDTKTGIYHEVSTHWLKRVQTKSSNPLARQMAAFALHQYQGYLETCKKYEVSTRRSLYDLCSGVANIANNITHHRKMVPMGFRDGPEVFYFPVFAEACAYRGKTPPSEAITAHVDIKSQRRPQTTKFGNTVLKS